MGLPISAHVVKKDKMAGRPQLEGALIENEEALSDSPARCVSFDSTLMMSPVYTPGGSQKSSLHIDNGDGVRKKTEQQGTGFLDVWPLVWKNQMAIFFNLTLTTLCYPGILTSIPCRQFLFLEKDEWFQTLLLTVFTLADIVARFCLDFRLCLNAHNVIWTVSVRALLFPLVLFCAISS